MTAAAKKYVREFGAPGDHWNIIFSPIDRRQVEQVFVSMLKTASADGVLTSDERRDAKDAAVRAARSYLGAHGVSELCKVLGLVDDEVDRLLGARVEAAVFNLRSHPTRMLGSVLRSALTQAARTAPAAHEANGAH